MAVLGWGKMIKRATGGGLGLLLCAIATQGIGAAEEVRPWAHDPHRNMYSTATGLPDELSTATLLWSERTGAKNNFGVPATVVGNRLLMGANSSAVRDRGNPGGSGAMICYDLHSGERIWQMPLATAGYGLCSAPIVEGERVYAQSGELLCLDLMGQANGNNGPFTDELKYFKREAPLQKDDGDILWSRNYRAEFGITGRHGHAGTPVVIGNQIWIPSSAGNGEDGMNRHEAYWRTDGHDKKTKEPAPLPPAEWKPNIYVFDKNDGRLIAHDTVRMPTVLHGCWSSLSTAVVNGRQLVFWGDGLGMVRAFAVPEEKPDKVQELEQVWRYDANPREHRFDEEGKEIAFPVREFWLYKNKPGPNYVIAAPVFWEGRLYFPAGRDYHYGIPFGSLHCVDPAGSGDITETGRVWMSLDIGRSANTVAITPDGLLFVSDNLGGLHCFDARSGEKIWSEELGDENFYCSPLVADGKVYVGTKKRELFVYRASRRPERLSMMKLDNQPLAPSALNGLLIVPTWTSIYVFKGPGYQPPQ